MGKFQTVFKRYEKKYNITSEQYESLMQAIDKNIVPDKYGKSVISNIYFDTPDFRLIRASIEKPVYKEKLRLRSYGIPTADSTVFVELKKKYKGIVYKRRVSMTYMEAILYLIKGKRPEGKDEQKLDEIDYCLSYYRKLRPAVSIFYDRTAYYAKDNHNVRITFDTNVRFRTKNVDLSKGDSGYVLLDNSRYIMEIKCEGAMPLWLTNQLDRLQIYPTSYSKYGEIYKLLMSAKKQQTQ